jgi:hypothetical protein
MAARKRRSRPPAAEPDEDLSYEDYELVDFIEQVGPNIANVYIWRVPKHGDAEYVDRVTVDMLKDGAEEYLRDTFGAPCKYQLRFKGSDSRWKWSKTINVGSNDKNVFAAQAGGQNGSQVTAQTAAKDSELEKEIRLIQTRQHEAFMVLLGNMGKGAPAADPSAMLTAVVAAFTAIKGATTPDGGLDLKKLKDIMEVMNGLKPTGPQEENLYTVVKDLGSKVVETVQGWRGPGPAPAQLTPGAPAAPAPANGANAMTVQDWIRAQLFYLKQKAMQNKEVGFWIDYIFQNEEEPGCAAIIHAIEQGATFENLLQFDPEIAKNPQVTAWFKALYDGLHTEIKQAVDTGGPAGNVADPTSHAAAGNGGGESAGLPAAGPAASKPLGA